MHPASLFLGLLLLVSSGNSQVISLRERVVQAPEMGEVKLLDLLATSQHFTLVAPRVGAWRPLADHQGVRFELQGSSVVEVRLFTNNFQRTTAGMESLRQYASPQFATAPMLESGGIVGGTGDGKGLLLQSTVSGQLFKCQIAIIPAGNGVAAFCLTGSGGDFELGQQIFTGLVNSFQPTTGR